MRKKMLEFEPITIIKPVQIWKLFEGPILT